MNTSFKSIWNAQTNTAVAVSEISSSSGKLNQVSTTAKNEPILNKAKMAGMVITAFMCLPAFALDCVALDNVTPVVLTPTSGADSFTCVNGTLTSFDGLGGDDTLNINNSAGNVTLDGPITFGSGNDTLNIRATTDANTFTSTSNTVINMGDGDDKVEIFGKEASGPLVISMDLNLTVNLGDGINQFNLGTAATMTGNVNGGNGVDRITIEGGTLNGNINAGDSNDVLSTGLFATVNGDVLGGGGNDLFHLGGTVTGIVDGGDGDDVFDNISDSTNVPEIKGGNGKDQLTIENATLESLKFDGGSGDDELRIDNGTVTLTGENITNVETVTVGQFFGSGAEKLILKGSQITFTPRTDTATNGFFITSRGTLSFDSNTFTINNGEVRNGGVLSLKGSTPGKTLTINGNYEGFSGSKILINTQLGGDSSTTDKLVINGNSKGTSAVNVTNVGGTGAKTVNGIPIIIITGNSDASFTLANNVQVGAFEYFLVKQGKNWLLDSSGANNNVTPTPTPTPSPSPSSSTSFTSAPSPTPAPAPQIYRPAVAGYLQAAQAQLDLNASLLSRFEQRQQYAAKDGDIWGRAFADKTQHKTSSFGYEHQNQQLQFGKKLLELNPQTQVGVTFGVAQQAADYYDNSRANLPTGSYSGKSSTTQLMVGATYTIAQEQNTYIDLQGQINSSSTKFTDIYDGTAKQTGIGLALSAEMGKTMPLGTSGFDITPQAQLVFQTNKQTGFDDAISSVSKQSTDSLRLRAGATLQSSAAKAPESKTNWNASLNVWQELLDSPSRTVAGSTVSADNSQKPWMELGLGLSHQLSEGSQLKAQISYQHSLSGSQRSGNAVNVSYQLKW